MSSSISLVRSRAPLALLLVCACTPPARISSAGGGGNGGAGGESDRPDARPADGGSGGDGRGGSGMAPDFHPPSADAGGADVYQPPGEGHNCGLQRHHLEQKPVEVLLVLDRSGSMNDRPRGGLTTKWEETTAALDETLTKTTASIMWGLKMFPSTDVTCEIDANIEVPAMLGDAMAVSGAYTTAGPRGDGTPTAQAIRNTVAYLMAHPSSNARYLVLATDGEPTCMDGLDGDLRDDVAAVQAVADAAAAGFHTFVMGIATGQGADAVLSQMAMAGGEPRATAPPYYPVANRQDLIAGLDAITGTISDCTFTLDPPPPSPDDVAVTIDGQRVTRDAGHVDGWDYGMDMRSLRLYGATCARLQSGKTADVNITYGCPGVIIP